MLSSGCLNGLAEQFMSGLKPLTGNAFVHVRARMISISQVMTIATIKTRSSTVREMRDPDQGCDQQIDRHRISTA